MSVCLKQSKHRELDQLIRRRVDDRDGSKKEREVETDPDSKGLDGVRGVDGRGVEMVELTDTPDISIREKT